MDEKSLELLELNRVREIVAGFASFSMSRELVLRLQPVSDYEAVSVALKKSAEARRLLTVEPDFSIGGISDICEAARMAARGKILEPQAIIEAQHTILALRQLRSSLVRKTNEFPLLSEIAEGIVELKELEKEIGARLTQTAEILDTASARLSEVRRQLRQKREELLARFDGIIKSPRMRKIIQEPIITERDGRYVIPVKIESRREIKGIIHDISNTGATAFMEPWSMVELGNEVRELALEEKHEIERILAELSTAIGEHETEIAQGVVRAAEIDLALAKARYARKAGATEPVLVRFEENRGILKLVEARHPLLGDKAVPLSLELGRDFSVLVITGPNTGGKTVALKTIGLLSLMALSGLPIPALGESCIPVFDGIYADIGDEQSIEQTLSSFSWHVGNMVRIVASATGRSLVLLDELGTNTDPAEGSALACSILLHFLSSQTLTVATTHYSDLKAFAHATPGLQNASLDFDPVTLVPTYHLTIGIPGGSNALATAIRLGLPGEIISRARDMLSKGSQGFESLLNDLAAEKKRLEALRREAEIARKEVEARNDELKSELVKIKAMERQAIHEARDRIALASAELHKLIRGAESELRKERTRERIEQARKVLAAAREELKGELWQMNSDGESPEGGIAAGDAVIIKDTDVRATVLSVAEDTSEIEVQAGATRLRLGLDRVEKTAAAPSPARPGYTPVKREPVRRQVAAELDLRGKWADEIEPALDSYLNDASLANLSQVRIIHGIGTGTVRRITRDFLAAHPLVKSFRSGGRDEGGDGATIVSL